MISVPEIDLPISDIIVGKKAVLYTPNEQGEFPNTFNKSFIPSSISINTNWYVGYAVDIMAGFNMIEISDEILHGLQQFDILNGDIKKYDKYGRMNPDEVKLEIVLTQEELVAQMVAKAFVMELMLGLIYSKKIGLLQLPYSIEERETWDIQYSEAKAYMIDPLSSVPFISKIAITRGVDLSFLVQSIVSKADLYRDKVAELLGTKQHYSDRVKACTTNIELNTLLTEINTI